MVTQLDDNHDRLHVYAYLFAEFIEVGMILDDTTFCKSVIKNNETEGVKTPEYKHIFKGAEADKSSEELDDTDLLEEITDILLDKLVINTGDDYREGYEDLINFVNQKIPGKWWEDEEQIQNFRRYYEQWDMGRPLEDVPDSLAPEGADNVDQKTQVMDQQQVVDQQQVMDQQQQVIYQKTQVMNKIMAEI